MASAITLKSTMTTPIAITCAPLLRLGIYLFFYLEITHEENFHYRVTALYGRTK